MSPIEELNHLYPVKYEIVKVILKKSCCIWFTGMSLSVLNVDDSILGSLDSATQAPAWPLGVGGTDQKPAVNFSTSLCNKIRSWAARGYGWFLLSTRFF